MTLIDEIVIKVCFVIIFVMIICWFAGVYYSLGEIATAAKKIITLLEKIAKENRK